MNTTRYLRLSNSTLTLLEVMDSNRSRVITAALRAVYDDPEVILRELQERLNDNGFVVSLEVTRVAVYLPVFIAARLDELVSKLRLPVEDIGRIAVEAHLRRNGFSQKDSNEPPRSVQHASEGRDLD